MWRENTHQPSAVSELPGVEPTVWTAPTRIAFRFVFCYFLLYAFCGVDSTPIEMLPIAGGAIDNWLSKPIELAARWIGLNIFHLSRSIATLYLPGTEDGALRWVAAGVMLTIALIATATWSVLDRRRQEYCAMLAWLRFLLRLTLGWGLLRYGFIKVFPIQMGPPPLAVLNEPVGNSSPLMLFWTLFGLNPIFEMVCGWMEVLTGVLLVFRRTALAASILAIFVVGNVVLYNLAFDVPVKLYSIHLLLIAFVLLAPELSNLLDFFWFHRPAVESATWSPRLSVKKERVAIVALELMVAVGGCVTLSLNASIVWATKREALRNGLPVAGEWHLDQPTKTAGREMLEGGDGQAIVEVFFDPDSTATLRSADGTLWRLRTVYDRKRRIERLLYDVTGTLEFSVNLPDPDHLVLTPSGATAAWYTVLRLTRVPLPQTYPLLRRGFHWVNDWGPFQ